MELFLMVAALSVLGVAVSAMAFGAATRQAPEAPEQKPAQVVPTVLLKTRFFVTDAPPERASIEALLLQIERHVRLEQAAAESFLSDPNAESLHTPSMSPLVH